MLQMQMERPPSSRLSRRTLTGRTSEIEFPRRFLNQSRKLGPGAQQPSKKSKVKEEHEEEGWYSRPLCTFFFPSVFVFVSVSVSVCCTDPV
jgi:hypothetical protein